MISRLWLEPCGKADTSRRGHTNRGRAIVRLRRGPAQLQRLGLMSRSFAIGWTRPGAWSGVRLLRRCGCGRRMKPGAVSTRSASPWCR